MNKPIHGFYTKKTSPDAFPLVGNSREVSY